MTVLSPIIDFLIRPRTRDAAAILPLELTEFFEGQNADTILRNLNTAFLICLAGEAHPDHSRGYAYLDQMAASAEWGEWAAFYRTRVEQIAAELKAVCEAYPEIKKGFQDAEAVLARNPTRSEIPETIWSVVFPEGAGILGHENARIDSLRRKRIVRLRELNPEPIRHPLREMVFTSNVLLTTPRKGADLSNFDPEFKTGLSKAEGEPQRYWYDHPISIGVEAANNEILYGLKHFDQAVQRERKRHAEEHAGVDFILSVSVTHEGLQSLGKQYLKQVLGAGADLEEVNIYAFTEADTRSLTREVLLPVVERCFQRRDGADLLSVFGVDGRYGRHYSFLKAIAAVWSVLIDPAIRATFKIDLDQVFPQSELIDETGFSAFEHFQTPLWGAVGVDAEGQSIELGMIAGALVNQRDIHKGLFTPDVPFPHGALKPDEFIFFSRLPQALSTQAEMMTRYRPGTLPDGRDTCLQRVHVTGGTNGILIESLRRFRPFTPGFIGRAEDQAYILSTLGGPGPLGYVHSAGLIMRHDKQGLAAEAIATARVGSLVGDYLRILNFSAYAQALPVDFDRIKHITDPFTGCFISRLPVTITLVRFACKAAALFNEGNPSEAVELIRTAVPQLREGLEFTQGHPSALEIAYLREREGWDLFFDVLDELEGALGKGEEWATSLQVKAREIVSECRINQ